MKLVKGDKQNILQDFSTNFTVSRINKRKRGRSNFEAENIELSMKSDMKSFNECEENAKPGESDITDFF